MKAIDMHHDFVAPEVIYYLSRRDLSGALVEAAKRSIASAKRAG
jgi:hypothetical protein